MGGGGGIALVDPPRLPPEYALDLEGTLMEGDEGFFFLQYLPMTSTNLFICPTPWKINDTEITEFF